MKHLSSHCLDYLKGSVFDIGLNTARKLGVPKVHSLRLQSYTNSSLNSKPTPSDALAQHHECWHNGSPTGTKAPPDSQTIDTGTAGRKHCAVITLMQPGHLQNPTSGIWCQQVIDKHGWDMGRQEGVDGYNILTPPLQIYTHPPQPGVG